MSDFQRPQIIQAEYRDDDGTAIPYGNKWSWHDGPPDDSYSVTDHPERFAPLHTVAETLIEYFITNFDVAVEEGYHVTDNLPNAPKADEVLRAVRITPKSESGASLVFVLTNHPSVRLFGGEFFTGYYPSCGCNACDEEWASSAEQLEADALSITSGGLSEQVGEPKRPKMSFDRGGGITIGMGQTVSYTLTSYAGGQGAEMRAKDIPVAMLDEARNKINALAAVSPDGNWLAWPLKSE